jgi:hypothetical protein
LTEPRLLLTDATSGALTFGFGMLEVGYPGFGAALGLPALGAALLAICSIGSACGGFAYGGMHFALPVERQLSRFLLAMALPTAAQAFVASPWLLAPLAFIAGVLIAPSLTALSLLVIHLDVDLHRDRRGRRHGGRRSARGSARAARCVRLGGSGRRRRCGPVAVVATPLSAAG